MTVYGYARVSTKGQSLLPQEVALREAGAEYIVTEKAAGTRDDRAALGGLLAKMVAGDRLIVWRLDRLGRSLPHLVTLIEDLTARGIGVESLHEQIDTSSANGKLLVHLFAALAQFERDLVSERTKAGLAAARTQGRRIGRPPVLVGAKLEAAHTLRAQGLSYARIADAVGVSKSTVLNHLRGQPPKQGDR